MNSERKITHSLKELEKESKKDGEVFFLNIRKLVVWTRLHHSTVKKAIERLKEKGQVLEILGPRNSRYFCHSDSHSADYVRKLAKDPFYTIQREIGDRNIKKYLNKNSRQHIFTLIQRRAYKN